MGPAPPAGPQHLRLFEQWMSFSLWIFQRTQRWPKTTRQSLAQRIENLSLEILEGLTSAAYGHQRKARLLALNDQLNRLRVLLRFAHEAQLLSREQFAQSAQELVEVGRALGAWMQREGLQAPQRQA